VAGVLDRRRFLELVERYYRCVKEIAITSTFEIKAGATVRKLETNELLEVVDGPRSDAALGVMRIRGRALSDNTVGWVTATGNHGTPFLTEVPKPLLEVVAEVDLHDGFMSEGSAVLQTLKAEDDLEVLEGPRKESLGNAMRARGKATLDGAVGWFTTKTKAGADCVKPGRSTYTCVSSIALTDGMDIKACKVVRKLAKGENLTVLEGPVEDSNAGLTRIRVQAAQDSAEGWVTVRGNAGTAYVEESGRQFVITRSTPLQIGIDSASTTKRTLEEEETIEVLEGPKEEVADEPLRVKCRAPDGKVGWVTLHDNYVKQKQR